MNDAAERYVKLVLSMGEHDADYVDAFYGPAAWREEVRDFLGSARGEADARFAALSPRERELVELMAQGRDNAQIAASMGLSEKTVRNHITSVFAKLEVENRAQAIVLARNAGFGRV